MSIPKEPRQLMINLMYLVLTALLALNVSAEVMNAFKTIDDSLIKTNKITDSALDGQQESLDALLEEKSKKKYKPLGDGVREIRAASKEFTDYVEALKDQLIDEAGDANGSHDDGDYLYADKPAKKIIKGKKNKDVTTRMLVIEGKGDELAEKVAAAKQKFLDTYSSILSKPENAKTFGIMKGGRVDKAAIQAKIDAMERNIALDIDQNWQEVAPDKKSWADFRFRQMPLISVLPLLTKFQTDAKSAEAFAVGELAGLVGGKAIVFNKFFPVINASKAYVIKGEKFEADISLGAYSSDIPPSNINLTVDGARKTVGKDGVAKYSVVTNSTGKKTIKLTATVKNPLTGESSTSSKNFEYEVGVRSANVSADKMNVFYMGVENPISVTAAGVSSSSVKASCSGAGCNMTGGNGKYVVKVNKPGEATISVSGGGLPPTPYKFRVKRIPDPVARLGKKADGQMGNGEFRAQPGVIPWLDNFDFDAKCKIDGFTLTRVPKRADPIQLVNRGGTFDAKAKRLVQAAKPGDKYYFENVKARCPGDPAGRKINSMLFTIK